MHALNEQAPTILRANTLKTTAKELISDLKDENVESFQIKNYPDAIQLDEKKNVFLTSAFKDGLFEVQDVSSQKIGELLMFRKVCAWWMPALELVEKPFIWQL